MNNIELLKKRIQKLQNIRNYISLKTFNFLYEKLESERVLIVNTGDLKNKKQELAERPQSLPKVFFEQRFLKQRLIRID